MGTNNTDDVRQILVRLPERQLEWLAREADARGVSRNYLVRRAVDQLAERETVAA